MIARISTSIASKVSIVAVLAVAISSLGLTNAAFAVSSTQTAAQQQRLQIIISKGDQEIARRMTSLSALTAKINAATKLTATDKATLSSEVTSTVSGLTDVKTRLDAETTVDAARLDTQQIYTDYRVYALVLPKVNLVKVADDIQVASTKLTALAQKLQTRITKEQTAGKDVSALQTQLTDLTSKAAAAQNTASSIETHVINLQPTDFNSDHALLSGYRDQLKTAHTDNQAAFADAKSIITSLKALK